MLRMISLFLFPCLALARPAASREEVVSPRCEKFLVAFSFGEEARTQEALVLLSRFAAQLSAWNGGLSDRPASSQEGSANTKLQRTSNRISWLIRQAGRYPINAAVTRGYGPVATVINWRQHQVDELSKAGWGGYLHWIFQAWTRDEERLNEALNEGHWSFTSFDARLADGEKMIRVDELLFFEDGVPVLITVVRKTPVLPSYSIQKTERR